MNYDEDSWNCVFKENPMRATSIWINHYDNKDKAKEKVNSLKIQYITRVLFLSIWKGGL